jgi:hypothetical protein
MFIGMEATPTNGPSGESVTGETSETGETSAAGDPVRAGEGANEAALRLQTFFEPRLR